MKDEGVKFGVTLPTMALRADEPFEVQRTIATEAEKYGYDSLWSNDHIFMPGNRISGYSNVANPDHPYHLECWTTLAAVSAVTNRIRIGSSVANLAMRPPGLMAKIAATVDNISGGRLIFGAGTGWGEFEFRSYGLNWESISKFSVRYEMMLESLEIIKKLWTEEANFTYNGKHFKIEDAPLWPKPVQKPRPPIWLGGASKRILKAVATTGDGWLPAAPHYLGLTPEEYAKDVAFIENMIPKEGKESKTYGATLMVSVAKSRSEASKQAEVIRRRSDWSSRSLEELKKSHVIIAGAPEDCAEGMKHYVDAGMRYAAIMFVPFEKTPEQLELFAKEVIPSLG